jgi:hypothetical protein
LTRVGKRLKKYAVNDLVPLLTVLLYPLKNWEARFAHGILAPFCMEGVMTSCTGCSLRLREKRSFARNLAPPFRSTQPARFIPAAPAALVTCIVVVPKRGGRLAYPTRSRSHHTSHYVRCGNSTTKDKGAQEVGMVVLLDLAAAYIFLSKPVAAKTGSVWDLLMMGKSGT